ncbi:N-acetylmuramoyl-L-alanine amidase-like isoform X1 [Chiloscyllium plagiosum]|uniref:N-acetylmuramoyl-L-alanine amidase-like isoform X1 n=1 Tax=Chiloscyllium plagiosum TaxID=36176 RepID=UPI001CB7C70F|nr:N-acetylmuramoyl-L-alanine amidase-like isoform X1 [Chiloscyllium plagiosum]
MSVHVQIQCCSLLLWWLYPVLGSVRAPDYHLDNVLSIIEELEGLAPALTILDVATGLGGLRTSDQDYRHLLLGDGSAPPASLPPLSEDQLSFMRDVMNHRASPPAERGVVLTPDGTTIALANLMAGIEAGLRRKKDCSWPDVAGDAPIDNLYALTLAKDLGLAIVAHHSNSSQVLLGPNGCWDNVISPQVFTGLGPLSLATDAVMNGGMDGFILGHLLTQFQGPPLPKLSAVLRDYYGETQGQIGLKANARRKNFQSKVDLNSFTNQVISAVYLYDYIRNDSILQHLNDSILRRISEQGVKQFHHHYLECPAIIPRCLWAARPYKGSPVMLALPLHFVYIHHTYVPSQPCTTFRHCAANMRSMQRFHQDVRQWDDIGYNFVAGSDGYIYEGRGWFWQGAHTKGQNSRGYGVSFIGNYTTELPDQAAMELVKETFMRCAVANNRIVSDYAVQGHRQHRPTLCPGERLFNEIKTWEAFREVEQANGTTGEL